MTSSEIKNIIVNLLDGLEYEYSKDKIGNVVYYTGSYGVTL